MTLVTMPCYLQNGKYRPIKFSNNMTVTEIIPKRLFNQANTLRKTIYQRARQIPRVGNKPIYLAVNPTNPATGNALRTSPQKPAGAPGGLPTGNIQSSISLCHFSKRSPDGSHLSKCPSDRKQKCTQTQFLMLFDLA